MMPSDLPPMEIIDALEEQLGMDFIHFTIDREGTVEGIFSNGFDDQTVTFEVKREVTPSFKMPPIESIIAELDENALVDMQKMMKSILDEIEGLREEPEQFEVQYGGHTPQFDGEWYCP
jgi:hypothetical protein|tara:strand:- start:179 stop:535 length:357 start_codon:yes stop_codon:yes gene_type:complete